MHLHTLTLKGFKSYTHPLTLTNFTRFNVITGSNGSGKSNILDSILFCLHLDNGKLLRVNKLEELINNSCQECEVTLTFLIRNVDDEVKDGKQIDYDLSDEENVVKHRFNLVKKQKDKNKQTYPASYTQLLIITRTLARSGKGKTTINGVSVTAVTLSKVLATHNLTKNCFNVIVQGNITKLLALNQNCKAYLEDLAGIKTYEQEKVNALAVLNRKEEMLTLCTEMIIRRLSPFFEKLKLERINYIENKKRIENKQKNLARKAFIVKKLRQAEKVELVIKLGGLLSDYLTLKNEIDMIVERNYDEIVDIYQIRLKIDRLNKQIYIIENNLIKLEDEKIEIKSETFKVVDVKEIELKLEGFKLKEKAILKEVNERERKELGLDFISLAERMKKIGDMRNNKMMIEAEVERKERELKVGLEKLVFADKDKGFNQVEKTDEFTLKSIDINNLKIISTIVKNDHLSIKQYFTHTTSLINNLKQEVLKKDSLTQDLSFKTRQLGYPIINGIYGTAFENFTLKDEKYTEAINVALGTRKKYIIVENEKLGELVIKQSLRHTNVIPLNKIRSVQIKKSALCAFDLITCDLALRPAYQYLLGSTFVFDDKQKAYEFCYKEKVMCVSVDGNLYDPRGIVVGGLYKHEEIIKREQVNKLSKKLERLELIEKFLADNALFLESISYCFNLFDSIMYQKNKLINLKENVELQEKLLESKNLENELKKVVDEKFKFESQLRKQQTILREKKQRNERLNEIEIKFKEFNNELNRLKLEFETTTCELQLAEKKESERLMFEKEMNLLKDKKNNLIMECSKVKSKVRKLVNEIKEMEGKMEDDDREDVKGKRRKIGSNESSEVTKKKLKNIKKDELNELLSSVELSEKSKADESSLTQSSSEELRIKKRKKNDRKKKRNKKADGEENIIPNIKHKVKVDEESLDEIKTKSINLSEDDLEKNDTQFNDANRRIKDEQFNDYNLKQFKDIPEVNQHILNLVYKKSHTLLPEAEITSLKDELVLLNAELSSLNTNFISMDPRNFDLLEKNEEQLKQLQIRKEKISFDKDQISKSIADLSNLSITEMQKARKHVNLNASKYLNYFIKNSDLKINDDFKLMVKINTWKSNLGELSGGQRSIIALCLIFSMLTYKPAPFYVFDEIDSALDLSYSQSIGELIKNEFRGAQFFVVSLKEDFYRSAECIFEVGSEDGKAVVCRVSE